ncbi:MFS transporter [Humibacter sp.]|uniref:MFS transporter n=1 Tax=Humibacter sp. TaxID=1940291 RepID=UPI002C38C6F6|nr:MFS transporter [Humibacter sp.]HVX07962.1 MFS transporter [Humibacter sp.]
MVDVLTLSPRASFWTAASVAGLALWSSGAPTIVYPLYERSWGLTAATSTLIFAIYPIVLIPVLVIFGNLSDSLGRRFAILLGLAALALGTLTFGLATGLPEVLIGRALMGVGVGLSLSPAAAAMIELGGPERAPRASSTMTAATAVGLALATIVGGALVQYAPDPLHLTFWVLFAVIVAVGALALFLPRVRDAAGAWRPSLPRVPAGLRRAFVAGALAVSAAYAVGSVFLALGAQVAADLLRSSNALLNGIVIAISAIAIGAVAVLTRRVPSRLALGIGPAAILFGMGSLVLAGIAHSMPLFVVSSVFTGGGYSLMYAGGLGIITATAEVHHRAAVISAAFTVGYLVQAVVALVLGAIATDTGLLVAIELAAVVVMAFAVAAALVANVRAGRRSPTTPVPVS